MIYNEETINRIKDVLISRDETIAVAESVTAGHLQAAFSAGVDASKYFHGGITTYNIGQKARHLNINPILCNKVNCVALEIAEAMAIEVSKMFISDFGVGITGYASIVEECKNEGLYAYYAISNKGKVIDSGKITSAEKQPYQVQVFYANQVIQKLSQQL